jgi:hydroxymethylbilane synthase
VTANGVIRIGTRRSALALAQSQLVAEALAKLGLEVELVEVTTEGDRNQTSPLTQIGGTGIFVSALRDALLANEVDIAVHSLKDLPSKGIEPIALAAVPGREDPRDVLVARDGLTLDELPAGARIGTGSPRRAAQLRLLAKEPTHFQVADIRGNVDTRVRKVREGAYDAVVLARAGLARLGRLDEVSETFDPTAFVPAPGQGALAVECRADDERMLAAVAPLDHPATRAAVTAERSLLAELEAGCAAPVGAFAQVVPGSDNAQLSLHAIAVAPDGSASVRMSMSGPFGEAFALGRQAATKLLADGAGRLIEERVT